jgi:hypothetical protein
MAPKINKKVQASVQFPILPFLSFNEYNPKAVKLSFLIEVHLCGCFMCIIIYSLRIQNVAEVTHASFLRSHELPEKDGGFLWPISSSALSFPVVTTSSRRRRLMPLLYMRLQDVVGAALC